MKNIFSSIKTLAALSAAALLLSSCEEFQPVFTGKYDEPAAYVPFNPETDMTGTVLSIKQLSQRFFEEAAKTDPTTGTSHSNDLTTWCWVVDEDIWVRGRITTSDRSGNFYKSFYIQDDADGPGLEIKVGRTSLHNDYKVGQEIYVRLDGLAVGEYGFKYRRNNTGVETISQGTVQVGMEDPTHEKYSTSYIEDQYIIDNHIYRCDVNDIKQFAPRALDELPGTTDTQATNDAVGALVTIKGLKYGNETFTLLYINGNEDTSSSSNRIFLSGKTWGITTLAMSKSRFLTYLDSGIWDSAAVGNAGQGDGTTLADVKDQLRNNANAYSVSQYFKKGSSATVQVRTSGYSKFADLEIDPDVLSGKKTVTVTGILTMYQGGVQLILRDQDDMVIE